MKITVLVYGAENPELRRALAAQEKKNFSVVFVPSLKELNAALKKANPLIATLTANCLPQPDWSKKMEAALNDHAFIVGETTTALSTLPSAQEQLSEILFRDYSRRAAHSIGHALPWGPFSNLGIRREIARKVGAFVGPAFAMDWCWRAFLQGYSPFFAPDILVRTNQQKTEAEFLAEIHHFGVGEGWIQKRYAFLQDDEDRKAIQAPTYSWAAAQAGSERLLNLPEAFLKANPGLVHRASVAFACGITEGHLRVEKALPKPKVPRFGLAVENSEQEVKIVVPGKGLLCLDGSGKELWNIFTKTKTKKALLEHLTHHYDMDQAEASHTASHFMAAIQSKIIRIG